MLDGGEWSPSCPITLPPERIPIPIEQEAEWAPEPVQMFYRRENSLAPD